ncbi:hypothetical protein FOE78_02925 [Microlunatus elymi]|uniref:Uncharacterized protein n=1 Tax=Microlunatus elymi TaxID=2596828 RepID=A0A516PUZ1_9ACTN|nr:hypothetical protein [Microlunatus elymi]QDP95006.1 hypothetical protein FOE78_02925 [Microlunatus elymi]
MRTDDGPRKLRAVWLGPKGATLPFEWTYVQWAVTLLMIPVGVLLVTGIVAAGGLLVLGHPPWFTWWFGLIYGGPAGVWVAVRLMRGVSFDEPLRFKITTLRQEWGHGSRMPAEKSTRWQMPWPRVGELHPNTDALLDGAWPESDEEQR